MYLRPLLCLICIFTLVNMADAAPFAYITNAGTGSGVDSVSIIDTSNNSIVKTIPIENPLIGTDPTHPYGVAVSSAGDRVYVSNQFSKTISVIDSSRSDNTVIKTITRSYIPSGLAVNPAGSRLYVANEDNASVSILDATDPDFTEITSVTTGNAPAGIALNSDGTKAYVTNEGSATVSVINANDALRTYGKGPDLTVGNSPKGIAFNSANGKMYVANYGGNSFSVITVSNNNVATVPLNDGSALPVGVAVNLDGSKVYVTKSGSDKVAVINASNDSVAGSPIITTNQGPWGVAVNVGGNGQVYVANSIDSAEFGTVTAYNATSGALSATMQVNNRPQAFGNFIGPMMYPITLSITGCGSISPVAGTDGKFWVGSGLTQNFAINPDPGCARTDVTVDGSSVGTPATQPVTALAPHSLSAAFTRDGWTVNVTKTSSGGGTGTVTCTSSVPYVPQTDISCGSTCSTAYKFASTVTCVATPDGAFTGTWTACPAAPSGNTCAFTVPGAGGPAPATLTANFAAAGGPVKIEPSGAYYSTIAAAYAAAVAGDTIKVKNATLKADAELLDSAHTASFNKNVAIKLGGGYDDTHSSATSANPSRLGSLEISNGTVCVENISIR